MIYISFSLFYFKFPNYTNPYSHDISQTPLVLLTNSYKRNFTGYFSSKILRKKVNHSFIFLAARKGQFIFTRDATLN